MNPTEPSDLLELYLLDEIAPNDVERVEEWLREDPARKEQLAAARRNLNRIETWFKSTADAERLAERILEQTVDSQMAPARLSIQRLKRPLLAAMAVASTLLVGLAVWRLRPDRLQEGPELSATLAANWTIEPTGQAEYTVRGPRRVRLELGEIHVASRTADVEPLVVETPAGRAIATDSDYVIGSHIDQGDEEMRRFTRVFVLSGMVTLTNSAGIVRGEERALLTADKGASPTRLAVQSNSDFAFDIYRQLAGASKDNLVLSPYSISTALAMVAEGARGETALEIGNVLRFPPAARRIGDEAQRIPWRTSLIHTGMTQLRERLTPADEPQSAELREKIAALRQQLETANAVVRLTRSDLAVNTARRIADELNELLPQLDPYELTVANGLWGEQTYPLNADFVETMKEHYATGGVFPADFINQPQTEAERINAWIEEQTRGRIKNAIDPSMLDPRTRMILANAIYFRGEWDEPFRQRSTRPRDFLLASGQSVDVEIMYNQKESARYGAFREDGSLFPTPTEVLANGDDEALRYPGGGGHLMVELPYTGNAISMVLLAPQDAVGLSALEEKLEAATVSGWIDQLASRDVRVYLPKFTVEATYSLSETLQQLGMVRAFQAPGRPDGADFGGMSSASADRPLDLYLSRVLHKALVEVHEKGTVAAAATVIEPKTAEIERPKTISFTPTFAADRPFLFLIRDNPTGTILFLGRVTDPR